MKLVMGAICGSAMLRPQPVCVLRERDGERVRKGRRFAPEKESGKARHKSCSFQGFSWCSAQCFGHSKQIAFWLANVHWSAPSPQHALEHTARLCTLNHNPRRLAECWPDYWVTMPTVQEPNSEAKYDPHYLNLFDKAGLTSHTSTDSNYWIFQCFHATLRIQHRTRWSSTCYPNS